MSSFYIVEGEVIEAKPDGRPLGYYKRFYHNLEDAITDFVTLVPVTKAAELRWSS